MSIDGDDDDTDDFINDINSRLDAEIEEEPEGREQHHDQAGDNDDNSSDNNEKQKHKVRLYRIAEQIHQKEDIFVDQYHVPYAFVKIHDHMEVLDLYSLRFQHWVYRKLISYFNGRQQ